MKNSAYTAIPVDENGYVSYSEEDASTWKQLFKWQQPLAQKHACGSYLEGMKTLGLSEDGPAQLPEVNSVLFAETGWRLEPVDALINFKRFFGLLAEQKFPAATFMRRPDQLEYLPEPDLFHEVMGHCPTLCNPEFATFTHWIGKLGIQCNHEQQVALARIYWFTIEFGLIREAGATKIFGGGILSSPKEITHSLDLEQVSHHPFDIDTILRTRYRIDIPQPNYFVMESTEQLLGIQDKKLLTRIDHAISDLKSAVI